MMKLTLGIAAAVLVAGAAVFTATQPSTADSETCTGKNMLTGLAQNNPDLADEIAKNAAKLSYGEGLLWRIETEGVAPSFVYGTMHLSDPRLLDLDPKVKTAFDGADTLALEITEILDPKAMEAKMQGMVKYTAYLDGTTISDRMTDEQEKVVSTGFSKRASIPWFLAKRLKPWALVGAIAAPACETARKAAGKPFLDQSLAQQADKAGKKLVALETLEGQIQAMSSLPEKIMVQALYETALMGSKIDDVFETMIALYDEEKISTVWAMMKHVGPNGLQRREADAGYAEFQREIVDKRNITMADASEPLLKKGNAFIAVGALHLPGDKGLLSILAQRGYKVTRE